MLGITAANVMALLTTVRLTVCPALAG